LLSRFYSLPSSSEFSTYSYQTPCSHLDPTAIKPLVLHNSAESPGLFSEYPGPTRFQRADMYVHWFIIWPLRDSIYPLSLQAQNPPPPTDNFE
jgi:hypothetical protein